MRKLISILFLFLLFGPLTVALSWLHYQKKVIHQEVKNGVISENKEVLVPFEFSEETFKHLHFSRGSEEFEYNGEMYDVIEIKHLNGKIILFCWHDSKETKINKQLDELYGYILNSNPQRNKTLFHVNLFMKNLYSEDLSLVHLDIPSLNNVPHTHKSNHLRSLTYTPPTPPPEFVF